MRAFERENNESNSLLRMRAIKLVVRVNRSPFSSTLSYRVIAMLGVVGRGGGGEAEL